jgi:hypothetical protein
MRRTPRFAVPIVALALVLGGPALAAAQEATPAGGPAPGETLLEVTLPADALPSWDRVTLSLSHFTVPPASRSTWEGRSGACCPGPKLKYLLAGSLAAVSDGPMQVVRAGGSGAMVTVPAGTEVVLAPGDTVITRNEHGDAWTNPGPTPVELLSMPVLSGFVPGPPVPGTWALRLADVREGVSLPAGAYTLRLERVALAVGAELPLPPGGLRLAITLPDEEGYVGYVGRRSDGTIVAIGAPRATVAAYVLTVEPAGAGAGTPTAGASHGGPRTGGLAAHSGRARRS